MIKIKIITLGKLKEKYLRDAAEEYIKRLSAYSNLEIIELSPEKLSDNPSKKEVDNALEREADLIFKKVPNGSKIIALCVEGKEISSEAFAENIKSFSAVGTPLCFVIGSSYGLSDKVKNAADIKMSVSKMTFPHQLFRIMLLEQIYRAFKINEGSTYHK